MHSIAEIFFGGGKVTAAHSVKVLLCPYGNRASQIS